MPDLLSIKLTSLFGYFRGIFAGISAPRQKSTHVWEAWWVAWSNLSPNKWRKGLLVRAKMEAKNKPYKKWGAEPKLIYLLPEFTAQGTLQVQGRQESGYLRVQTTQLLFHYLSYCYSSSLLFVRGLCGPFSPSGLVEENRNRCTARAWTSSSSFYITVVGK